MGNKRICWAIKIASVSDDDYIKGTEMVNEAMTYYENKLMSFAKTEGVPAPDSVFMAAAAAKISEMFYNSLDDKGKRLCNLLVNGSSTMSAKKVEKRHVNRENGEFEDEE